MNLQEKYMNLLKIDVPFKHYKEFYGEDTILILKFMIKRTRNGLKNEACNDYLLEEEYTNYWYVGLERVF